MSTIHHCFTLSTIFTVARKFLLEGVIRDHDLNLTVLIAELDRVLNDVVERLLVELPVRADPVGDQVRLHHVHLNVLLLELVVEGSHEL